MKSNKGNLKFVRLKAIEINKQISYLIKHNEDFKKELFALVRKYGVKI